MLLTTKLQFLKNGKKRIKMIGNYWKDIQRTFLMLMVGETCLQKNKWGKLLENKLVRNESGENLSVNVINRAHSLNLWIGEKLMSLWEYNMIMSGLNMDILIMILIFKMLIMQYIILGINTTIRKFLIKCGKYQNSLIYDDN